MIQEEKEQEQRPLVSIVLPTYNGERYLRESLDSIIAQDYAHFELIIVDDASTDETPQISEVYAKKDRRISVIRNAKNRKLPGALNVGFSLARGALYTWTSDDNMYRPGALNTMVSFLRAHPEIDLVYTSYSTIDDGSKVIRRMDVEGPDYLWRTNVIGGCFMYRKEMAEKTGLYDESRFVVEDYEYWLRAARHAKIAQLKEDLYLYREHGASLTAKYSHVRAKPTEDAQMLHLPYLPFVTPETRFHAYARLTRRPLVRGEYWTGLKRFGIFFKSFPLRSTVWLLNQVIGKIGQKLGGKANSSKMPS